METTMKIFISWSGSRSKAVANALKKWLPDVLQTLDVWMSAHDIDAGARWNTELDSILEATNFGILCLTPENQNAPWLLFEAGALAKTQKISRVIPYLVDLRTTDVQFPLAQFQGVLADKEGTYRLLQSISEAGGLGIAGEKLERAFVRWWPDLEKELLGISQEDGESVIRRTDRDILEEILGLLRSRARQQGSWMARLPSSEADRDEYLEAGVSIDARPFFGNGGRQVVMPYVRSLPVSRFLDRVYRLLNMDGFVRAFTYGDIWLLEDSGSGHVFDDIGIEYCRSGGINEDLRPIENVGIHKGTKLRVVPVRRPSSSVNRNEGNI
jgi:hypothetical protein